MRITKCDYCGKTISETGITAGYGVFERVDLCAKCGKPIDKLLKKYKLLVHRKKYK